MASRTQMRLGQLTGSLGTTAGKIRPDDPAGTLASKSFQDLSGSLSAILSGVSRIHGRTGANALNNAAGTFYTDILPDTAGGQDIGSASQEWGDIYIGDHQIKIGAGQEHFIKDGNTGLVIGSSEKIDIGVDANTQPINIGTVGQAKTITIGDDASNKVDVNALAIELDSAGTIVLNSVTTTDIDSAGALSLNSSAAAINIGNDAVAQAINLGTGAAARTISLGNVTGATELNLRAGSGNVDIGTAEGNDAGRILLSGSHGADSVKVMSDATFDADVVVTGNFTVNGTTTTVSTTNMNVEDALIGLQAELTGNNTNDIGFIFERGTSGNNGVFVWDESEDRFTLGTTTDTAAATGNLTISAGTLAADIVGDLTGIASQVTVTDSTANTAFPVVLHDESNALLDDTGAFTYNPSTGELKAPKATVDDVSIDGKVITMTGDTSDTVTLTAAAAGQLTIATTDDAGEGGHINLDADGDIVLDPATAKHVSFKINGTEKLILTASGMTGAVLSSSLDNDLTLATNNGQVFFTSPSVSNANIGAITPVQNSVYFGIADGDGGANPTSGFLQFRTAAASAPQLLSGSIGLLVDAGADAAAIRLLRANSNTNFMGLKAGAVAAPFTLTFPNSAGSAGQVLKIASVSGDDATLEFGASTGDLARLSAKVTSAIAADSTIKFRSDDLTSGISILKGTQLNITKAFSDLDKSLEVFVNGQLLMSGAADNADADYTFVNSGSIRFEFGLETDDIVQIIQR